jgi:tape measure domain-containing protein
MLIGLGGSTSKVVPQLKKIGDIAAQSGASVQDLTVVYTQMVSSGKLNAGDMMQLVNQGVNAWPMLAKSMGKSVGEVRKLGEQGKIGSKDIQKFWDTLAGGAKGSTAALAQTLSGMISTLKDTFDAGLRDIGTALLPFAKVIVPQLTAATKGMGDKIASVLPAWIETLANGAKSLVDFGGKIMGGMKAAMVGLLNGIAGFQSSLGDMLGSFGGLAMSIAKALVFVPGMGKIAVELAKSGKGMVDAGDNMKTASAQTAAAAVQAGKSWDKWIAEYNKGANKAKAAITGAQLKSALVFSTGNAQKNVDSLTSKLKALGKQKSTPKVRADTAAAESKLKAAQAWLRQLSKYQANPKLLATDLASGKVKYVKGQLQSVPKSKQVALNAKDNTKGPTTSAKKNVGSVPSSKHSNLTATDGISPKAKNAKSNINSIPGSKTFTLNYHTNYSSKGNPSGFSPSNVPHSASATSSSAAAPPTVQIYVNDQALASLIDVRVDGRATRATRVVNRRRAMVP